MTIIDQPRGLVPTAPEQTPPLENGDRLTAEEFERRYDAMPELKKAELINGVVYMPSPVSVDDHGGPHFDTVGWLSLYRLATPGIRGADNATLRLPLNNRPQPDACLFIEPSHSGQVRIVDRYIVGGPELVVEVTATSASYDLHDKLDVYRQNTVHEYIVWKVLERAVEWHVLRAGRYEPMAPAADGQLKSEVLPGLWLDPAALVTGDMARVAQVAHQGIASPEHAAFVARLQQAAASANSVQ